MIVDLIVPELKKPKGESELKPYFPEMYTINTYIFLETKEKIMYRCRIYFFSQASLLKSSQNIQNNPKLSLGTWRIIYYFFKLSNIIEKYSLMNLKIWNNLLMIKSK